MNEYQVVCKICGLQLSSAFTNDILLQNKYCLSIDANKKCKHHDFDI